MLDCRGSSDSMPLRQTVCMQKRLFHFSYPTQQPRGELLLHALRDGDAFAEIEAVLLKESYTYHGLILNFPAPDPTVISPSLGPFDLVVLTTRPPSKYNFNKKHIKMSGTGLEESILKVADQYFELHSRSLLKLSGDLAARLQLPDRGEIEFSQYGGARYLRYRDPYNKKRKQYKWQIPPERTLTAAFVLFTRLWQGGPLFLNAFGMDGPTTLIWCYLLRTRFPELLRPHRFVMAELVAVPFPQRPSNLSFADNWDVSLLLNHELSDSQSLQASISA
jgi:hypothetical protein